MFGRSSFIVLALVIMPLRAMGQTLAADPVRGVALRDPQCVS